MKVISSVDQDISRVETKAEGRSSRYYVIKNGGFTKQFLNVMPLHNYMIINAMCRKFECRKDIHYKTQTGTSCEKCKLRGLPAGNRTRVLWITRPLTLSMTMPMSMSLT